MKHKSLITPLYILNMLSNIDELKGIDISVVNSSDGAIIYKIGDKSYTVYNSENSCKRRQIRVKMKPPQHNTCSYGSLATSLVQIS